MFFSKVFKPKQLPETELEREFILLHDILGALRGIGISASRIGSEASGHKPIYEYNIESSQIEFATLGAILNKAEIVNPAKQNLMTLPNIDVREEDVEIKRCTWQQLSKAVDTLEAACEIKKVLSGGGTFYSNVKSIHLTKKGMYSFNTRKYETLYYTERDKREIQNSTITTNYWMRWFTGAVTFSTLITFGMQLYDKCQLTDTATITKQSIQKTMLKLSLPDHTDRKLPAIKPAIDSIHVTK